MHRKEKRKNRQHCVSLCTEKKEKTDSIAVGDTDAAQALGASVIEREGGAAANEQDSVEQDSVEKGRAERRGFFFVFFSSPV